MAYQEKKPCALFRHNHSFFIDELPIKKPFGHLCRDNVQANKQQHQEIESAWQPCKSED